MRVIIIGAGLIGVSTAYYLARYGHQVAVLDRREAAGMETSFANSGMVTPSQADPWNSPASIRKLIGGLIDRESPVLFSPSTLLPLLGWALVFLRNSTPSRFHASLEKNAVLANYSLKVFREIREELGIRYEDIQNGTLKLYRTGKAFERAIALSEPMNSMGVNLELLDADAVVAREPALAAIRGSLAGGVYYPDDEAGDAHLYCREMARQAQNLGALFHFGAEVEQIHHQQGKITGLTTTKGGFTGDVYVLAGGSYSAPLGKKIGLSIPVKPIKGYSITLELGEWRDGPRMPVIDDTRHIAITPLGRRLRVAGMAEFAGFNTDIRADRIEQLSRFLGEVYPHLRQFDAAGKGRLWAGLRPYSCDGVPMIGQAGPDNLHLNTGHGHLGWSLSAGSGKLLADHISGHDTEIDIIPYRFARF